MNLFPTLLVLVGVDAASRPWLLNELGREFINKAVQYRMPNVPQNEASEIASRIESGAVAPPQVTTLIEAVSEAFMQYGTTVPPGVALSIVQRASTDYEAIKKIPGFLNYLEYVSANANKFNFEAIQHDSSSSPFIPQVQNVLAQLTQTAQGKEAYDTALKLLSTIEYDAGIQRQTSQHQSPPPQAPLHQAPPQRAPPQRAPPPQQPPAPNAPYAPQRAPPPPQGMNAPPAPPVAGALLPPGSPHPQAQPGKRYSPAPPRYLW